MDRPRPRLHLLRRVALGAVCALALCATASAGDAFKWSVQYLIDNSRTVFGRPQKVSPRHNRGLAISPDGKYLYAGYIHSFGGAGEVRKLRIDQPDYDLATVAVLPGPLGKAIATDDKGRVYITDNGSILVYDAALRDRLFALQTPTCDGVAAVREGAELALYGTGRDDGSITRWVVHEKDDGVTDLEPKGLGGEGRYVLPGATDLRGLKADGKGNLWVADLKGNRVSKISLPAMQVASIEVSSPMDIALDRGRVFVTRYRDRAITVLDESLNLLGSLSVPWEELELSPFGNNHYGALASIVTIPGQGFFVANEGGQTANQRSTYGRTDDHTDVINGKVYRDAFGDDNEPILRATEVTLAE